MAGADIWAWANGCQTEVPSNLWEIAVGLSVTQGGENVTSTERRNPKTLTQGNSRGKQMNPIGPRVPRWEGNIERG